MILIVYIFGIALQSYLVSSQQGSCPGDETIDGTEWLKFGSHCYYVDPTGFYGNWDDCVSRCIMKYPGSQLVSILSKAENDFVITNLTSNYIGLFNAADGSGWKWQDGSPYSFSNWDEDHPVKDKNIVWIEDDGSWRTIDTTLGMYNRCMCKLAMLPPITDPDDEPGTCPQNWARFGKHCFWFAPNQITTWENAKSQCENLGGPNATLASITMVQETNFIHTEMYKRNIYPEGVAFRYWIGLVRSDDPDAPFSTFEWLDGSEFSYSAWDRGEPDYQNKCVVVDPVTSKWENVECGREPFGFVCKVPKGSP